MASQINKSNLKFFTTRSLNPKTNKTIISSSLIMSSTFSWEAFSFRFVNSFNPLGLRFFLDSLPVLAHCLNFFSFFPPKSHQSFTIQLLLVLLDRHQALHSLFLTLVDMGSHPGQPNVLPDSLGLVGQTPLDEGVDLGGVFGIEPQLHFGGRQDYRHSLVHFRQLRRSIFGQNDHFVLFCEQARDHEVVCTLGSEHEGLLFGLPLVVAFHDDHAPVLDDLGEGLLVSELLNPAVDNHVEVGLLAPLHKRQLPLGLILNRLFLCHGLVRLPFVGYCFVDLLIQVLVLLLPLHLLLLLLFSIGCIEVTSLDDRNVGGGANVEGGRVELAIVHLRGAGDPQQAAQRQGLEQTATHLLLLFVIRYSF